MTMGSISTQNGVSKYDPKFTQNVIDSMGPGTSPRMREVMTGLIRHVHDFAREVELTVDEWMAGVQLINWAGQMSDAKRNEGQLVCDVIGLESLVDEIAFKKAAEAGDSATASAILGPFWRKDTPVRRNGDSISFDTPKDAVIACLYGTITSATTGKPIANATVDVWQASTNGLYEQQDADQVEHNLRGVFHTDEEGRYSLYCIKPTPYPVPFDGPAGKLLQLMDRHPYRPAHIHFMVKANGHKPLVTQIFDSDSDYLENDSVFAVKDGLQITFSKREGDPKANWEVRYDLSLCEAN